MIAPRETQRRRRCGSPTRRIAKASIRKRTCSNFTGTLQADGYAGFDQLYEAGRIQEAACWAHVRRKFYDLQVAHDSPVAAEALERIGAAVCHRKRNSRTRAGRAARGPQPAGATVAGIAETMAGRDVSETIAENRTRALAVRYALGRWDALLRYVDDGRIEIDNNAAERALRTVALGRKNYLFAGSDAGGERAAAIYSLIGTAKLNGLDPEAYLRDVLPASPTIPSTASRNSCPGTSPPSQNLLR